MQYEKPELAVLGLGLQEVRGGKSHMFGHDSYSEVTTEAAYEADE
jgi:hypothetical protein